MVPFVLAILFSYLVGPIVDWMQVKPKMPRGVSILFALLVVLGLITLIIMLITVSARGIAASAPIYRERLASMDPEHLFDPRPVRHRPRPVRHPRRSVKRIFQVQK